MYDEYINISIIFYLKGADLMSLLVVDPTSLQEVLQKLEGNIVTVSSTDENISIMRTFHKLEIQEDQLYYYFAEMNEEYISCQLSKHRVNSFKIDLDTVILYMENGLEVIISTEAVIDQPKKHLTSAPICKVLFAMSLPIFICSMIMSQLFETV